MGAAIGVILELPEMDKLIDRSGVGLEIADQVLVVTALWSAGYPSSWYSLTASAIAPTRRRVPGRDLGPTPGGQWRTITDQSEEERKRID